MYKQIRIAAAILLFSSSLTRATALVVGPFPDFKGYVLTPTPVHIPTVGDFSLPFYPLSLWHLHYPDSIDFNVTLPTPVFAPSYWTVPLPESWEVLLPTFEQMLSFFSSNAPTTVTDIYAVDLNPSGSNIVLQGFDPINPEITPASDETFFGRSGAAYTASIVTTTVGNLYGMFPDYDLTSFDGSDPSRIVYVATATIPVSELGVLTAVPESSTYGLISSVILCAGMLFRRISKRRRNLARIEG